MRRTTATASAAATRLRRLVTVASMVAAAIGATGCGDVSRSPTVNARPAPTSIVLRGAGTTAAFPIYEEIGSLLTADRGIALNYQLSGPGSAMASFRAGRISFLSAASSRVAGNLPTIRATSALYVPVGFSAVAVIYHLPSLHARLKLSAKTLADVFLGRIRAWDDRAIKRENPGVALPPTPIAIVHGSTPSDATTLLTSYLAAASKKWRRKIGSGPVVKWPGGAAQDSDDQIQNAVAQTVGAIGYVEQPIVLSAGLRAARLLDPRQAYVAPTLRATTAVGNGPLELGSLSLNTVNSPVVGAYPLVSENYVLVYRDLCEAGLVPSRAAAVQHFLAFLLGPGQATVGRLSFAPLPPRLRDKALAAVSRLRCASQSI